MARENDASADHANDEQLPDDQRDSFDVFCERHPVHRGFRSAPAR
jgi:hypothetical protein